MPRADDISYPVCLMAVATAHSNDSIESCNIVLSEEVLMGLALRESMWLMIGLSLHPRFNILTPLIKYYNSYNEFAGAYATTFLLKKLYL
jgi:hypothetical protein